MTTVHLRGRVTRAALFAFGMGAAALASGCDNVIGVPLFTDAAPDGAPIADAGSKESVDVQAGAPADAEDEFRSAVRVYGAPPH